MPKKGTPLQELLREYKWRRRMTYPLLERKAESKLASLHHLFMGRRGKDTLGLKAPPGRRPIIFRVADALNIPKRELRRALIDTYSITIDEQIQKYSYHQEPE